jgi:predicted Co/Zn/Cd cation transporter (cation efflux family)
MVCLATPPVVMVLAAWVGARVGLALESHALFFLGMLSFASVALVFLVTQELLIEVGKRKYSFVFVSSQNLHQDME